MVSISLTTPPASRHIRSRPAAPCGTLSLLLLLVLILVSVVHGEPAADSSASSSSTNLTAQEENRQYMDKAANAALIRLGLNTLTTSCNGGCGRNAPCVLVGAASNNRINCVNDTRCTTLSSGKAALCMEPFNDADSTWTFTPARRNDSIGAAPFEQVGLVQPGDNVKHIVFRRADPALEPLGSDLDVSSINIQPNGVIANISFDGLRLTGVEDVLSINVAQQLNIVNCSLKTIPVQMVMGSSVRVLDLSRNAITTADNVAIAVFTSLQELNLQNNQLRSMNFTSDSLPFLTTLLLDGNNLSTIPPFVFNLTMLTTLSITNNPVNASLLDASQFEKLARLQTFYIDGVTETKACPSNETIAKLNDSFTFCVGVDNSGSGSNGPDVGDIVTTAPTATTTAKSSSGSKAGLVVGIVIGSLAVLAIIVLIVWWCTRRRRTARETEAYKPTYTSMNSFVGVGGAVAGDWPAIADRRHDDALVPLPSNASSDLSSDSYPVLGNLATDGPDGLPRLSYQSLYFDKLMRVSSRSELWLGEFFEETVVIKKIKVSTVSRAIMRDYVEEVKLMATLKHERIVRFRGALWDDNGTELCAVVEYMERGPLRNISSSESGPLPVATQHAIGRQIAEALTFLHSKNINHGRLNAFNILLGRDYSAKISLFSIFHYVRLSPLDYECAVFVAPEVQQGKSPSEKADVYAFGVVLVELDAGESPEQNRRRRLSLQDSVPTANSPTGQRTGFQLSTRCSPTMKSLITACVERDPARRPSMAQISAALRTQEATL